MKRKILMLALLTAVFALLLCVGAWAYEATSGQLIVNGTDILVAENNTVKCGDGTAVYDEGSQTLTLENATITVNYDPNYSSYCQSGISVGQSKDPNLKRDLKIVLVGENKIITNNNLSNGIYVAGGNNSLTISGEGSLSITCNNGKCGIYSASNGGDIIIDGVKLDIHSEGNNGVGIQTTSGSVSLQNGADVSCTCGKESIYAFGGSLTIENSRLSASQTVMENASHSIYSTSDLKIVDSIINCKSVSDTISSKTSLYIDGGSIEAQSYEGSALYGGKSIDIKGSANVKATNEGSSVFACLYSDGKICIDGADLNATSSLCNAIAGWAGVDIIDSSVYADTEHWFAAIDSGNGDLNVVRSEVYASCVGYFAMATYPYYDQYSMGNFTVKIEDSIVTALSNSDGWESISGYTVDVDNSWVVTDNGYYSEEEHNSDAVVFNNSTGQAYGDVVLPGDAIVPEGCVLVLNEGESLTIPEGVTLTNYGTIQVLGGSFTNNGTYIDYGKTIGEIKGSGSFPNNCFVTVKSGNGAADVVYRVVKGEGFTLPEAPQNSGYIFLGWRSGDATYRAGESVDITSNATFTAVWGNLPDVKPSEPETPDTPVFPFYDVTARDWYYSAVKYVYEKGLMDGVDVGVFAPNDTLTRAMVWTIIARAEGVDTTGGATWYAKAQEWVTAKGISDGENPNAAITRQELVTMLYRLAGEPAVSGTITAPDAASVSTWATNAMTWAMNIGLVEGDENGAVTPTAIATRAQAAALIMRYLES